MTASHEPSASVGAPAREGSKILVLGGGVGGVVAANRLRKRLGPEHQVVLVDKSSRYIRGPSLLWLMVGLRQAHHVTRDLRRLERKGIEFVEARVTGLDPKRRTVVTDRGKLSGDYLILALGARLAHHEVFWWRPAVLSFYCLNGAQMAHEALANFRGGRIVVLVTSLPFKCPAAPYEAALLIDDFFRRRRMRGEVEICVCTPESQPLPVAGPRVGAAVREVMSERGIHYYPGFQVDFVDAGRREAVSVDGDRIPFDLCLGVPPHKAPAVVSEAGLSGDGEWVPVDSRTLQTPFERVFALGDLTAIPIADTRMMLPKAGVFAHYQAEVVADNIAAEINGRDTRRQYRGDGGCFLEVGRRRAGFARGNFYALPAPELRFHPPRRRWHWKKALFERWWLRRWF